MKRYIVVLAGIAVAVLSSVHANITEATNPEAATYAWPSPTVKALKRVSGQPTAQQEPTFFSNLDCTLIDYRLVNDSQMRSGCFTESAFGLFDTDTNIVIFNGTDEGIPIASLNAGQILAPWPKATNIVSLDNISTGGTALSMYRNPMPVLENQRNILFQLTSKKLTAPPDIVFHDDSGRLLTINPQTISFSSNGSWMVFETLTGTFVRLNLATLSQQSFAPSFGQQGSPGLLKSQVAVSDNGRYISIANDVADSFKVYDLKQCSSSTLCTSYDYFPFVSQQISGLQRLRHLRFVNDGLLSFQAYTASGTGNGVYEVAPTASITALTDYIGLGDSYTSGEGAFDYMSGTDTTDNQCHLSALSYPKLLTRDLFSAAGGHSVACSGAVINDVGSTNDNYRGQVHNGFSVTQLTNEQPALLSSVLTNYLPGYIAQQKFVQQYQPRITTVSVGGNDIGFGAILENCVEPHPSRHANNNTCYNTYEDRIELTNLIDRTVPRWVALFKQLKQSAPESQVYSIGYPRIVSDTGNCALNTRLGKSELEFAEEVIGYLNTAINKASTAAGVTYVDISQALIGHRLCETASYNVAVNGLTAGKDSGAFGLMLLGKESYHPNALGHALIEQTILKQTHNFTVIPTPVTQTPSKLLNAPKTGRVIQTVIPNASMVSPVIKKGATTTVKVAGTSNGLKPNTNYNVRLDGLPGTALGTAVTDANGDISTAVIIPVNTDPGGHTIDVTGSNQTDDPIVITQPVYVPANDTDADDDGIPNTPDSCPSVVNSGVDSDQDGVDDICDTFIAQAPPTLQAPVEPRTTQNSEATLLSILPVVGPPNELGNSVTVATVLHPKPATAVPLVGHIGQVLGMQVRRGTSDASSPEAPQYAAPASKLKTYSNLPRLPWMLWSALVMFLWLLFIVLSLTWRMWSKRHKAASKTL